MPGQKLRGLNQIGIALFSGTNRVRKLTKGHGMPLEDVNKKLEGRFDRRVFTLHATKGYRSWTRR